MGRCRNWDEGVQVIKISELIENIPAASHRATRNEGVNTLLKSIPISAASHHSTRIESLFKSLN